MVKRMVRAAANAVKAIARKKNAVKATARKKVERRELLIVVDRPENGRCVLIAEDDRFLIPPDTRTMKKMYELLRTPWPFVCSLNVVNTRRLVSFVRDHVEYDVVNVAPCDLVTGGVEVQDPYSALEKNGFILKPLGEHPYAGDIKRVMGFT